MRVLKHFVLWNLGLAEAETQTSQAERQCLFRHASGRKRIVEVGVWHGVNTRRLRSAMSSDGILLGVDPFPPGRLGFSAPRQIALREVGSVRNGTMRWERSTSVEAARRYAATDSVPPDFVFIDAEHTYEGLRQDWEAWSPLVGMGGIVALHDSCSSSERQIDDAGSVKFTNEVIRLDQRFELVETVDTLTIFRRVEERQ